MDQEESGGVSMNLKQKLAMRNIILTEYLIRCSCGKLLKLRSTHAYKSKLMCLDCRRNIERCTQSTK